MMIQIWKITHMKICLRFSYIFSRSVFSFLMAAPSFSVRISLHYPSIQKCKAVTSDQIITSMFWWTIALLNRISDLQKTTSRQDTETTLHTLFHGVSFHQAHPTIVQVKDATSALKTNSWSSADLNCHHLTNVMNSCLHAVTETKRCCVRAEQTIYICHRIYYANFIVSQRWLKISLPLKSPKEWFNHSDHSDLQLLSCKNVYPI